jgi:hypothetical protein
MRRDHALIAPLFNSKDFPTFQQLHGCHAPWEAADSLVETLDGPISRSETAGARVDLVGYSGGAQFVHRFAMRHPDRVRSLVISSAGWYTRLDASLAYPYGVADPTTGESLFDIDAFLALPMLVMVGENDTERDSGLRMSPRLDRHGPNRLQRALRWVDHVEEEGRRRGITTSVAFDVLPACGHSFEEAVAAHFPERVDAYLAQTGSSTTQTSVEIPADSSNAAERDA